MKKRISSLLAMFMLCGAAEAANEERLKLDPKNRYKIIVGSQNYNRLNFDCKVTEVLGNADLFKIDFSSNNENIYIVPSVKTGSFNISVETVSGTQDLELIVRGDNKSRTYFFETTLEEERKSEQLNEGLSFNHVHTEVTDKYFVERFLVRNNYPATTVSITPRSIFRHFKSKVGILGVWAIPQKLSPGQEISIDVYRRFGEENGYE